MTWTRNKIFAIIFSRSCIANTLGEASLHLLQIALGNNSRQWQLLKITEKLCNYLGKIYFITNFTL